MVTSLYGGSSRNEIKYYFAREGERRLYCSGMLSAEASSKYILSNHHIDEIITLGSTTTYDPGDELVPIVLREGSSFYDSDPNNLSNYSLLRYRLAQYIDEISIEKQDLRELLSDDEQTKVKGFIRDFFRANVQTSGDHKFNRFFDILTQNGELRDAFYTALYEAVPEASADSSRYSQWIMRYLYDELKDTSKLELLEGNENVKIRFIPTDGGDSLGFANTLNDGFKELLESSDDGVELDMYICIQSDNANDTVALMNFMEIVKAMPDTNINIKKIATGTRALDGVVNEISDDTTIYGISDLLTGLRAFLRYGKTDLLRVFWKNQNSHDGYIERLLAAMRNIDYGISLCDIADIERGINSLRKLFNEGPFEPDEGNIVEHYFALVIEAIKQDYGVLVTGEKTEFIDLVKWAYRKEFWQQTLTLIESRGPEDMLSRGLYYYCDSEEHKQDVIQKFGQIYFDLKQFEKYKLDDIAHYFIKFYGRNRVPFTKNDDQHTDNYVRIRTEDLSTDDPEIIRAYTICPDTDALSSMLYEYYRLGFVRNLTNHAGEGTSVYASSIDEDISERMSNIRQSIEGFIRQYDIVLELCEGLEANVVNVTNDEIRAFANTLKPRYGSWKDKKDDRKGDRNDDRKGDRNDGFRGDSGQGDEKQDSRDNGDRGNTDN